MNRFLSNCPAVNYFNMNKSQSYPELRTISELLPFLIKSAHLQKILS